MSVTLVFAVCFELQLSPEPLSSSTPTLESSSIVLTAFIISSTVSGLNAFFTDGLFMVRRAMEGSVGEGVIK